jgi:hypothetical protein
MMSKQTAIILILVVFLGALGALLWFYFSFNDNSQVPAQIVTTDVYDPFGTKATDGNIAIQDDTNTDEVPVISTTPDKLRKISTDPISGFSITENIKTKQTDIHYILRANGNIYETYTNSPEAKRLSITTIPKVYESAWLPDGQRLIIRYLRDNTENIETFSVKINPATTTLNEFEGGVEGNHLVENINSLAINPVGDKIFYLTKNLNGSSGFISKPDGLNKKLIFESPLVEWLISWPTEEIITMSTKPSAKIPGYLYFLNSKTGNFSKVLGNINGLTTKTNANATEVLYSDAIRNTPRLYLYNIKSSESKLLPWNTLPEKCLWGKTDTKVIYCAVPKSFETGDYPDIWYQGLTSFTDDIWMLNTETMASTLILDPKKDTANTFDIIDMQIDKNDNYLLFTNKIDLTLWSLNLK